jgi:geranylgeranyl pyrophosphate synthase
LQGDAGALLPDDLRKVAVAVECFHKASLIHDDIEDNDALRYGEKTLHEEHGMAVACDLLIGEGYRLLASSRVSAEQRARMLQVAADGQRQLCRGQGAELCWARKPTPLRPNEVLDIFRRKTAPAFEVALRIGAFYAGVEQHDDVSDVLGRYSEALGVAYQIRDDLSDLGFGGDTNDITGMRPSLLLAIAHEKAEGAQKELLASIWRRVWPAGVTPQQVEALYAEVGATSRADVLLGTYKEEAIRSLHDLENHNLKGLLRRTLGKIFDDVQIKGWCKEQEQFNRLVEAKPAEALPA